MWLLAGAPMQAPTNEIEIIKEADPKLMQVCLDALGLQRFGSARMGRGGGPKADAGNSAFSGGCRPQAGISTRISNLSLLGRPLLQLQGVASPCSAAWCCGSLGA